MAQGVFFGDYLLLGKLSRGGMAEVFLARSVINPDSEELYAIKRTLPDLARNRDFASMFMDEARIAKNLDHPNICKIEAQGEYEDKLYIAMEFIHGKDLRVVQHRAYDRGEPLPFRYVAFTIARIATALDYAHNKKNKHGELENIVHRDVSPQNILISYAGVPKLIDFGIAKAKSRIAKTRVGILKGKLAYMSPEQAMGLDLDFRSDIFALGIVMYEMLTGHDAFRGKNDYATLQHIIEGRFVPPRKLNPEIPLGLEAIVTKALATRPEDRFASAMAMSAALDAYLMKEGRGVSEASLSSFMRKLFRDDYIREISRIKTYTATPVRVPKSHLERLQKHNVVDATAVAPSFIKPGEDSRNKTSPIIKESVLHDSAAASDDSQQRAPVVSTLVGNNQLASPAEPVETKPAELIESAESDKEPAPVIKTEIPIPVPPEPVVIAKPDISATSTPEKLETQEPVKNGEPQIASTIPTTEIATTAEVTDDSKAKQAIAAKTETPLTDNISPETIAALAKVVAPTDEKSAMNAAAATDEVSPATIEALAKIVAPLVEEKVEAKPATSLTISTSTIPTDKVPIVEEKTNSATATKTTAGAITLNKSNDSVKPVFTPPYKPAISVKTDAAAKPQALATELPQSSVITSQSPKAAAARPEPPITVRTRAPLRVRRFSSSEIWILAISAILGAGVVIGSYFYTIASSIKAEQKPTPAASAKINP